MLEPIIRLYMDENKITISLLAMSTIEVSFRWFHEELCAGTVYNKTQYRMISDEEVYIISTEKFYLGKQFTVSDGMVIICASNKTEKEANMSNSLGITTIVFVSVSMFRLVIRMVQIVLYPRKTFPLKMQFNLVLALFSAFAFLLITPFLIGKDVWCSVGAAIKHWAFLAAFCWMNNIAFNTWTVFRSSKNAILNERDRSVVCYMLYGWCLPLIIAAVSLGLDYSDIDSNYQPKYADGYCWFSQTYPLVIFYIIPVALCIFVNVIFFFQWTLGSNLNTLREW